MVGRSKRDPKSDVRADAVPAPRAVAARQQDPMVRTLIVTILLIIVLTLVTVVYALITDVFGSGAPRTAAEQRIVAAEAKIEAGSVKPADWMAYIIALINDGRYDEAQEWIDKGKTSLEDQQISADMSYMQAQLYFAQDEFDMALETADEAISTIQASYQAGKKEAELTGTPNKAFSTGLHDNYWELLLLKAEIYEQRKDWSAALSCYDEYLGQNPTAATVYAQRGAVREQLGDTASAEADYRQTLSFIPDDPTALDGLERIGADR